MSVYYGDYLQLDKILNAQVLESEKAGAKAHDEMLFIVTHQTYELWFKQVLFELGSVRDDLFERPLPPELLGSMNHRLKRVVEILHLLVQQIKVMETMTPLDFMDFRDYLQPASGFQSVQFRSLETMLGLKMSSRMPDEQKMFPTRLSKKDIEILQKEEKEASLFEKIEEWLERMPFGESKDWNFWEKYSLVVEEMMKQDQQNIERNSTLDPITKERELNNLKNTHQNFLNLLDNKAYLNWRKEGFVRFSQKAMHNALFIFLYRDWPIMHGPFHFLNSLIEIDESLTAWRQAHAMMAQRLLGTKIGTGGSSGHEYLKKAAEKNRAFVDLFNLSTFLIPKSKIPPLPSSLQEQFSFRN